MKSTRLDIEMAARKMVPSRSQAESYIRLGKVKVNGKPAAKTGQAVSTTDLIELAADFQFVGRAALKLQSADAAFSIDWKGKTVLDVGSSTGGFTQYALLQGAKKVIAVDVGTDQLHPSLRGDERIELHEKTDIRDMWRAVPATLSQEKRARAVLTADDVDIVVCDVSFISLREIMPHILRLVSPRTTIVAMVKPQFEAVQSRLKHHGVIKNDTMRREVLKDFEIWVQKLCKIVAKIDSGVAGAKGNVERFYCLQKLG